jgi:hypothetical protein
MTSDTHSTGHTEERLSVKTQKARTGTSQIACRRRATSAIGTISKR